MDKEERQAIWNRKKAGKNDRYKQERRIRDPECRNERQEARQKLKNAY